MRTYVLALTLVACVHRPPVTPREQCAAHGLALHGIAMASGRDVGVASADGVTVVATSSSYDENVSCRRAMTHEEVCELQAPAASLRVKLDFSTGWRNALIGVGYVAYILPGVILWFVFDSQSDAAGDRAHRTAQSAYASCLAIRR
jgi:hypothetical protein